MASSWGGDPYAAQDLVSVQRCEAGLYSLVLWPAGHAGDVAAKITWSRAFCGSWRCPGCAYGVAMQDLRRLQAAVSTRPWWLYVVLTVRPGDYRDPWQVYQGAGKRWNDQLKNQLRRRFGHLTYVQTWEAHASGWPHVNLLLSSQALQEDVERYNDARVWTERGNHGRGRLAHWTHWSEARIGTTRGVRGKPDAFGDWAQAAGFGPIAWLELVDDPESVACYMAKVAREIGATLWKRKAGGKDQRPMNAPPHFRRIRASRGMLPSADAKLRWDECRGWRTVGRRGGLYEGVLVRRKVEDLDEHGITWSELASCIARRTPAA